MAKLIFKTGTMNSGKSLELIKTVLNYEMAGKKCLVYTSKTDNRNGVGVVSSRNGDRVKADLVTDSIYFNIGSILEGKRISAIVVDECQFLSIKQVELLADIVDDFNIPVLCFGLLVDFTGKLFDASKRLVELSDNIENSKTICVCCESKATMNLRTLNGKAVYTGEQIQVGDNEYYPVCRKCYKDFDNKIKEVNLNRNIKSIVKREE